MSLGVFLGWAHVGRGHQTNAGLDVACHQVRDGTQVGLRDHAERRHGV